MKFDNYITYILEYFIDNSKAYYIDSYGEIHNVDNTHFSSIIEDYDLEPMISREFEALYDERIDWDEDADFVNRFVRDYMKEHKIFCLVHDIRNQIIYVRSKQNSLNELQRKVMINFCISKNCELEYDEYVFA